MNEPSWTTGFPGSILLATDLSARSDRALDRAALLARQWNSRLSILHVLEDAPSISDRDELLPSWRRLPDPIVSIKKHIAEDLSDVAATATILVEEGPVVDTIMRVANRESSDLIAIGVARNELLGALMLGRTVDGLLRRSRAPLLVVKKRARQSYRRIVVATDFSESSRHALVAALRFFPDHPLTILHAYDPPMASRVSDAASYRQEYRKVVEQDCDAFLRATDASGDRWRRHQILNEYGSPSALLRDYVVDNGADLVIVGTHGRSAIFDILIGSVAKQILNDAPCDILVVREPRAKVEA